MKKKQNYCVRNWQEYNKFLVQRGNITLWFDQESIDTWYKTYSTGEPGQPATYSDEAIECCVIIKSVFHLPLRQTQGFIQSLLDLMGLPLNAPDYSCICKRQRNIRITLPKSKSDPLHLVIDSTGLKLYGEGEWEVREHGKDKRRSWIQLHVGINENTHEIQACVITSDNVHDSEILPDLLSQVNDELEQVTGDGAYDTHASYQAALKYNAIPCFPPRANASRHRPDDEAWRLRNLAVSALLYGQIKLWKNKCGYHRRSIAETAMYHFKQIFGHKITARTTATQAVEIAAKCKVMNMMTALGMPVSQKN